MKKIILTAALIAAMTAATGSTVLAAGWQNDTTGWWYSTNDDNHTRYTNGWQWIDGNGDGIAECYYFNENGTCLMNTTTPDGYTVNTEGAWTLDGVVQQATENQTVQNVQTAQTNAAQINGLYLDTNWNDYYYLQTLENGSLQLLHSDSNGTLGDVYMTLSYQGNNTWNDAIGTDATSIQFSNQAWLTEMGVHISMGGYMQRNLIAQ